jgi:recombinational DNA repair ATPase RecF
MHILGMIAENVKKIRVVEIEPKGRVVQITGKNGQGKTSVLDAIWYGLVGKRALPEKPVRKGADSAKIKLNLGELLITRTISAHGGMTLQVQSAKGEKFSSPQQILDEMLGELTFDPLAFVAMKPREQLEALRSVVKLEVSIEELNAATQTDFEERRIVNRDVERLKAEVNTITVQAGLPAAKQDEAEILAQLANAGELNKKAEQVTAQRAELLTKADKADLGTKMVEQNMKATESMIAGMEERLARLTEEIARERETLKAQKQSLATHKKTAKEAREHYDAAPMGEMVDVSALTTQLQQVQLTNREIDKRSRREGLEKDLKEKQRKSDALTRAMEDREEKKRSAIAGAKMPVEGLTFDEEQVLMFGIPLDQLGEAEQIKISTSIAMAANPKLRILRIMHGEALDDDTLAVLAQMAEEHDFQIWMARVDSSGKVGLVMEDGMVKEVHE